MRILRFAAAPLISAETYTRWVYIVLGGVLFTPFLIAVLVLISLITPWDLSPGQGPPTWQLLLGCVIAAVLGGATGLLPGVRRQQVQLTRHLVGGPLAEEPPAPSAGRSARVRAACWLALHFLIGMAAALATMVLLTDAASLALSPIVRDPGLSAGRLVALPNGTGSLLGTRWADPFLGAALVLALIYGAALIGAAAARAAPRFLGASAADRLAALQSRADDLSERNRLAAELHDSIGHALSVVTLQAGAAARVLDRDPEFARTALDAIAEQARTATAELDHVLGLLREEQRDRAPRRTLADLPHLAEAARAAGTDLDCAAEGPIGDVPPVISRELYRICQEGVTNALRHGARGGGVRVRVSADGGSVRVSVANPVPPGRRPARRRGGRGLLGMAERVRLLGGELRYGADGGTWLLEAEIPGKGER
ncbi:sensor histidine kinase [Nocardiopsis potens]|uniref:sensor histidine kinase n=1 Tax=Nocardiopsis potens TaxID=1246458 RepID=UPI00034CFCFB|nr:histidine kinase [Nocardiopsis potens]